MGEMQTFADWETLVTGVVGLGCVGYMVMVIARMLARRASIPGSVRPATDFESALVTGELPSAAEAFDGFSYRVPARFAGKVRVVVGNDAVVVVGPRVPRGVYVLWIWVQGLSLAMVPAILTFAAVRLDWRALLLALTVWAVSFAVSSFGAGLWTGLGEMPFMAEGRHGAVEFPLASVSEVKVGAGWSDGGIDVVLLPYKGAIDKLAEEHAVSFTAPDGEGRSVRYAIHIADSVGAHRLAALLRG
jgi:hypothetical protein